MGAIWAHESRRIGKPASWNIIGDMTLKEMSGYFAADPEGDDVEGKVEPDSPDARHETPPDGASPPASGPMSIVS